MYKELIKIATELRLKVLENIYRAKQGHIGGTYSALDIFVYLYFGKYGLKHYVDDAPYSDRDRLVIGKGHACLALYNIWDQLGLISVDLINNFGKNGAFLSGQLNLNTKGVEYNTGSLGHAIGISVGMAMAGRMDNKDYLSIALIGDGECSEGSIWEAVEFAGKEKLSNLLCIVDYNRLGVTAPTDIEGGVSSLAERAEAYGWDAMKFDGHDFEDIEWMMKEVRGSKYPILAIAETIKGKGVSFMENGIKWHHSVPSEEEYNIAKKELEA